MTATLLTEPLGASARQVDAALEWCLVRVGMPQDDPAQGGSAQGRSAQGRSAQGRSAPDDDPTWTRCADVDAAFLTGWERRIAAGLVRNHGRSNPMTVAGFSLDWYAGVPGQLGGAMYRLARRVPRLDRASLAFTRDPAQHYPRGIALLDPRFWCLPADPDADHPAATVVDDEVALAGVLRAQVRAHADDFLADFRPSARLPRRGLLGAFFDGLDTGVWFGGEPGASAAASILAEAAAVLPGGTAEFRDASSIYRFVDARDRAHVARRRVGCCYYFKVAADDLPCTTCPRVDDAQRVARYSAVDD